MQPGSKTMNPQPAHELLRREGLLEPLVLELAFSVLAIGVMSTILGGKSLSAQTRAPHTPTPVQLNGATSAAQPRRSAAEHSQPAPTQSLPVLEVIPPQPSPSPAPVWPAEQRPNKARVSWDGRRLEIEASNSSLNEILNQVAADTGAKFEGLTQDQRIFGSYGPGSGRDVLLNLLDGCGYNVIMTGSPGADAPLEIVLSARLPAAPQNTVNNQNRRASKDEEAGENPEAEPQPPPANQNPFHLASDGPAHDPRQFMQEILQRQRNIDQQQHQQKNPQQ